MAMTIGFKWRQRMKHFYYYETDPNETDKEIKHKQALDALAVRHRRKMRLLATFKAAMFHDTIEERAV